MKNIIEYFKGKSLYILLGVVVLLIIVIAISACSSSGSSNSYVEIENKMVAAAKKYYEKNEERLPKIVNSSVKVSIATLVDNELLKEVYDVKNKSNKCSGDVEVTKLDDKNYSYIPFLVCKGNYEPKYLKDEIVNSEKDEYGNGVYFGENNESIYRGDSVNNYIKFNNELWRILKIDNAGDIKILLSQYTEDYYPYDDSFNVDAKYNYGITTNYLQTKIRKTLKDYYDEHFSDEAKAKIVSKNICVGSYMLEDEIADEFSVQKECSVIKENERISLMNPSDYKNASLSSECKMINSQSCANYNYLKEAYTWLLNPVAKVSYRALYLTESIMSSDAKDKRPIQPVVYLTGKTMISGGTGTKEEPYIIK